MYEPDPVIQLLRQDRSWTAVADERQLLQMIRAAIERTRGKRHQQPS